MMLQSSNPGPLLEPEQHALLHESIVSDNREYSVIFRVAEPKIFIFGSGSTFLPYFGSSSSPIQIATLKWTYNSSNIRNTYVSVVVEISFYIHSDLGSTG